MLSRIAYPELTLVRTRGGWGRGVAPTQGFHPCTPQNKNDSPLDFKMRIAAVFKAVGER